jgi:antitoxin (DNA-binding transcriptional repressor) of toxin-antitoxin stability system
MRKCLSLVVCGVLLLPACGGSPTATLSVSGSPAATLSAPSISFGNQVVDTVSAGQTITVSNTGSAGLRIVGIAVALPFTQTNTCTSSLAVGATCTINVTFLPTTVGDFTSNVSVTDNATGSPQTVALSGAGVAQPPPGCTPQGGICGPGLPKCCAAPFPHHSFCSNPTGFGTCVES